MKITFNLLLVMVLLISISTDLFGWSRTDARPFRSTQYRFKVWAGTVYKPYPNGSWSTAEYEYAEFANLSLNVFIT